MEMNPPPPPQSPPARTRVRPRASRGRVRAVSAAIDEKLGERRGPWIDVGPADLEENELRALELEGRHLLLARSAGEVCALDDQCNHAGCLLSGGWVEVKSRAVVCPCHEFAFELSTGHAITVPRLCEDQDAFPVRVEDGRVLVQLQRKTARGGRDGR